MNKNLIIGILFVLVIFLLGIVVGQNFTSRPKEESSQYPRQDIANDAKPLQNPNRQRPNLRTEKKTQEEFWISKTISEQKQTGISVWIDFQQNGALIVEHCSPPDFDQLMESKGLDILAEVNPKCTYILEGTIFHIRDNELSVSLKNGRGEIEIAYTLRKSQGNEELRLSWNGVDEALVPGDVNDLLSRIRSLSSVKKKSEAVMKAHEKHIFGTR